jgi:hypothetical protein
VLLRVVWYKLTDVSEVLIASIITAMSDFWDNAPGSLVEIDRRFSGAYCRHHQGDE